VARHGGTAVSADTTEPMSLPTDWRLPKENINDMQQRRIEQAVRQCKRAHFVNLRILIDGTWEEFEADWLKYLVADR
jgi:hypothetical protein